MLSDRTLGTIIPKPEAEAQEAKELGSLDFGPFLRKIRADSRSQGWLFGKFCQCHLRTESGLLLGPPT